MADRTRGLALAAALVVAAVAAACAGTSGGSGTPGGAGGTGATAGGGGVGGSAADGGLDAAGGLGGSSGWSWGGGSSGTGGTPYTCDAGGFWPCTFNAACTAVKTAPADHDAYRTTDCRSCHGPDPDGGIPEAGAVPDAAPDATAPDGGGPDSGSDAEAGAAPRFLFSGFVWDPYAPKGEPGMEVGVGDGNVFYYACTDARGFFFIPLSAGPEPDWKVAESHLRSAIGEKIMPVDKQHGPGCNSAPDCHGDPQNHLFAPL